MKAVIIGGGIAGLASALALTRRGWQVEVLERAPEFTEVGAGLSLWPNALRALDALGVGEVVRGRAVLQGAVGIRDPAGRWLSRTDTADLERRYGLTAMIHRADLLAVLRAAVPEGVLRPGTLVSAVRADGTVTHSGGECRADLVVGADGVNSVTRQVGVAGLPGAPLRRLHQLADGLPARAGHGNVGVVGARRAIRLCAAPRRADLLLRHGQCPGRRQRRGAA